MAEKEHITEYDNVDPLGALHLALLARVPAFTPEYAAGLRRTDPRPFPFLAVYAVGDNTVLGQVGVFRLPMITIAGPEEVGGVGAVARHSEHAGREAVSLLLDEAHTRMRAAGLRFSILTTNRLRAEYEWYREQGYVDMQVWATALARWETAHLPTRLRAQPPGPAGYQFVEQLYQEIAENSLGFGRRHTPFTSLHDKVSLDDIWILWQTNQPIGYAVAHRNEPMLEIHDLALRRGTNVTEAVAAVVTEVKTAFIHLTISRPTDVAALRGAGWQVAYPDWSAFMVKPLIPAVTVDARWLFGIGTDRFLISWLDEVP